MNLVLGLLTLLVSTNMCLAAVKGGRRIIQEPAGVSAPHLHLSKGGGGGALHHTAVVQDPISGGPILVDKVTKIGGSGGIKGAGLGLGAGASQYTLADGPFGQRRLYRVGASQHPFGLLGSDYYSYPNSLLTSPRRVLRRKTVNSNNLSGLRPIGLSSGLKGGVLVDPTASQFSLGDAQIKTNVFGARTLADPFGQRRLYRVGASQHPFGLLGSDYYSYPNSLLTSPRRVLRRKTVNSNNLSGLRPIGLSSGLKGGVLVDPTTSQFSLGDAQIKTNVFGARTLADPFGQRRLYRVGASQHPFGLLGSDYYSYPNSLLTSPRGVLRRKTVSSNNLSGLRPVGLSSGLKGGVLVDPTTSQFSIGDAQIKTNVFGGGRNLYRSGLSPVPYGLMGLDYYSYPRQLLTQRRLADNFGLGQSAILGGGSLFTAGDSQIRGPIASELGQEEVTIVETDPSTGGQRVTTVQGGSPLGVLGLGGSQLSQEISQDPIEAAIAQATLGDSLASSFGQSVIDPLGSGQAQVSVDDIIAQSPFSGGLGGGLLQQSIADAVVQESISSGIGGGYDLGGYLPRVSFLNQHPYDVRDDQILRSVLSRPIVQQQQEVEQILVK